MSYTGDIKTAGRMNIMPAHPDMEGAIDDFLKIAKAAFESGQTNASEQAINHALMLARSKYLTMTININQGEI